MSDSFQEFVEDLTELDRLIHDPSRLAILTVLRYTGDASFLRLQRRTNLSRGNISNHLSKLERAGIVSVEREFAGRNSSATASLTDQGRKAIDAHWNQLDKHKSSVEGEEAQERKSMRPNPDALGGAASA